MTTKDEAMKQWGDELRADGLYVSSVLRAAFSDGYAAGASNERADDLSALVARLARALRKAAPDNDLSEKALDYLKREGLTGSPLRVDAEKDAALTALAGLVHIYVGLCRDSGIDPGMNTQYRNARAILAANKGNK